MADVFAAIRLEGAIRLGAIGDRCCAIHSFSRSKDKILPMEGLDEAATGTIAEAIALLGAEYDFAADQAFYRRSMSEFINDSERPFPDRLASTLEVAHAQAVASKHLISMVFLPSKDVVAREGRAIAETRTAQAALAIELHRLGHNGALPPSLIALVPARISEVPTDPFTGRALLFVNRSPGYAVYSVGPDKIDNHGLERADTKTSSYDLVFTVRR